jgi:two-component system LytT family response regulator
MSGVLRVLLADDERPARQLLGAFLRGWDDVRVVGEAADGGEAVELIERERPDLALLDLQMPELDGLGVVRVLRRELLPLVAFVTAYDEYAVRAFEANAIDYLLKPVDPARLRHTISRAQERLEQADVRAVGGPGGEAERLASVGRELGPLAAGQPLRRIPVRRRDGDVVLVPTDQLVAAIADGETLHLATRAGERHTITYRLKDLEARLEPGRFVRLSRSSLVAVDAIATVSPMPGGTYRVLLRTGQRLSVSRLRARVLREELFRL